MHLGALLFLRTFLSPRTDLAISAFAMLLALLAPLPLQAQLESPTKVLTVKLTPNLPGEFQQVKAEVESFSIDLDRSTVTWFVNGKVVSEGQGIKSASFTTGALGGTNTVRVTARAADGATYSEVVSVIPADIDLVYESNTYTHPFYKGKSLLPATSAVTITALPNMKTLGGVRVDPKNLVYTWREGTRVLGNNSGSGRNTLTIDGPQVFRTLNISVEASTVDNSLRARKSISITGTSGLAALYQVHPLLGVLFDSAIPSTIRSQDDEISVIAMPYFFTAKSRNDAKLTYTWKLNGQTITNPASDSGILVLRPEGSGTARLDTQITGSGTVFERASASLNISFSKNAQTPL